MLEDPALFFFLAESKVVCGKYRRITLLVESENKLSSKLKILQSESLKWKGCEWDM